MSTKVAAKKAGKENAPPSKYSTMDEDTPDMTFDDADPLDGDMSDEPTVAPSKTRPLSSSQPLKSNKPPAKTNKPAGMPSKPSSKPIKPVVRTHSRTASDSKAKSATRDAEEADDFDDMEMDVDGDEKEVAAVRARNDKDVVGKKVAHAGEDQGQENVGASEELVRKVAELERQLSASKSSLRRTQEERDSFAKQFEKLSTVQANEGETAFAKYKEKAEVRAKAQNELIATLTSTNVQLQTKLKDAERCVATPAQSVPALAPALAAAPADETVEKVKAAAAKELRAIREQMSQMKKEVATKDEQLVILQKDYDTEVRLSKEAALKRSTGAAAAPAPSFAESAKDTLLIKLYEDLTNLAVPIIKIKEGGAGQEVTFVCVQTVDGRSLNFKLRCYNEYQQEEGQVGHYVKKITYEPLELDKEQDESFLERLEVFKTGFSISRDQGHVLFERLRANMIDPDSAE